RFDSRARRSPAGPDTDAGELPREQGLRAPPSSIHGSGADCSRRPTHVRRRRYEPPPEELLCSMEKPEPHLRAGAKFLLTTARLFARSAFQAGDCTQVRVDRCDLTVSQVLKIRPGHYLQLRTVERRKQAVGGDEVRTSG